MDWIYFNWQQLVDPLDRLKRLRLHIAEVDAYVLARATAGDQTDLRAYLKGLKDAEVTLIASIPPGRFLQYRGGQPWPAGRPRPIYPSYYRLEPVPIWR
jgi:hypothetical protein